MRPFNRGWPLNGGPLNRGSTVLIKKLKQRVKIFFKNALPPLKICESVTLTKFFFIWP